MLSVAAALLGIAATATVAWSASQLAATRVGLAGDPLSVTSGLAPASTAVTTHARTPAAPRPSAKRHPQRPSHATTASSTASVPTPLPVAPSPPVTHAPAVAPPVTSTVTATPTTASTPPARHTSARHRDDS